MSPLRSCFFVHAPAPTEIYTLSLHDALPISSGLPEPSDVRAPVHGEPAGDVCRRLCARLAASPEDLELDRKSTRLNSSHLGISYAVFCLKKKTNLTYTEPREMPVTAYANQKP